MLILSKHSDYYDGVAHAGIDKSIVYKRLIRTFTPKTQAQFSKRGDITQFTEVKVAPYRSPVEVPDGAKFELDVSELGGFRFIRSWSEQISKNILFFCGKAYPYCSVRTPIILRDFSSVPEHKVKCFYDNMSANNALLTAYVSLRKTPYMSKYDKGYLERIIEEFNHSKRVLPSTEMYNRDTILNLHRELHSPIILVMDQKVESNVNLRELGFPKVMDPYTAFQEISMFIGGVLGNHEKEVTELTEKDRIQQHGFDKWSFRKMREPK